MADRARKRGRQHISESDPLRSSRRGQTAATRVGTLCASAGRWGLPAAALVAHGCLPLRHPLALRPPAAAFAGGPGVGPLSRCPPLGGFIRDRLGASPWLPPSSVADGPPVSIRGGSGPGRTPSGLLGNERVGGHLGCFVCFWPAMLSVWSLGVLCWT
jgi:hypothetical protein